MVIIIKIVIRFEYAKSTCSAKAEKDRKPITPALFPFSCRKKGRGRNLFRTIICSIFQNPSLFSLKKRRGRGQCC